MSSTVTVSTRRGLTSIERDLVPLDDGFVAYWGARRAARARMVRAARATLRDFRAGFGYGRRSVALLTPPDAQPKTGKNNVPTFTLMLVPERGAGFGNACPMADGCAEGCLASSGKGAMYGTQYARMVRMAFLVTWPWEAGVLLAHEIRAGVLKFGRIGFRPNCVSDIRWELATPRMVAALASFSRVELYDYTAWSPRFRSDRPAGYSLTFSAKVSHDVAWVRGMLADGHNVAIPFNVRRGQEMPSQWNGLPVIDGDVTDLRPSDPVGVIVGLRAKGDAIGDTSGFVRAI